MGNNQPEDEFVCWVKVIPRLLNWMSSYVFIYRSIIPLDIEEKPDEV